MRVWLGGDNLVDCTLAWTLVCGSLVDCMFAWSCVCVRLYVRLAGWLWLPACVVVCLCVCLFG